MVEKARAVKVREGGEDVRRLIYRVLAPSREIAERTVNAFRSMLLIAKMGVGKTSWAEAMLGETIAHLVGKEGLDERQIGYVYAEAVPVDKVVEAIARHMDLSRIIYLFIFSDDAAAAPGQHGRQASLKANVEVSKFYIRIRHVLRKRYGYERAVTAIHATQVYHLIDKTFREGADIDVLKGLPKSQVDRRQIASLIHPDYVSATFGYLRELSRRRLTARSLREFLEAIYTAVVVIDGFPFIVRAYRDPSAIEEEVEKRKAWLRMVQHLRMDENTVEGEKGVEVREGADGESTGGGDGVCREALYLAERLLSNASVISRGADFEIKFKKDARVYIRKHLVEGILKKLAEKQ